MAQIAFIGLGKMGLPMASRLIAAGHGVTGCDKDAAAIERLVTAGGIASTAVDLACHGAEFIITMLPSGAEVREVYLTQGGILASAPDGALLIDASSIDIESARAVAAAARVNDLSMLDAPVSGGPAQAEAGELTFIVGGMEPALARARPLLESMGRSVVHAGGAGSGQAAKICNNMILGATMIAISEAFALGERLGIPSQTLFDICNEGTGRSWTLEKFCPVPGPVPQSPANHDYAPGFAASLMLKDLKLAQAAAKTASAMTPLTAAAAALYSMYVEQGNADTDFSGIIRLLNGSASKDNGVLKDDE